MKKEEQLLIKEVFPNREINYLSFSRAFTKKSSLEEQIEKIKQKIIGSSISIEEETGNKRYPIYVLECTGKRYFSCSGDLQLYFLEEHKIELIPEDLFLEIKY